MNTDNIGSIKNNYKQLSIRYDKSHEVLWSSMTQKNIIPCFNTELINDVTQHQLDIEKTGGILCLGDQIHNIKYAVAASSTPNVFNLGGQLALIRELAMNRQKEALQDYAIKGLNALAHRIFRFNIPTITTITLLQGQTLGAGLEVALTSDVIIAERKTILGFPEIMFNTFPGMGGYSLVARKAGTKVADEMLLKGKFYTAEQAHQMGLVDVLVDDGHGEKAVYEWIENNNRLSTGFLAIQKTKSRYNRITYEELVDITHIWLDTVLKLSERDFGIMDRFISKQASQYLQNSAPVIATDNVAFLKQSA